MLQIFTSLHHMSSQEVLIRLSKCGSVASEWPLRIDTLWCFLQRDKRLCRHHLNVFAPLFAKPRGRVSSSSAPQHERNAMSTPWRSSPLVPAPVCLLPVRVTMFDGDFLFISLFSYALVVIFRFLAAIATCWTVPLNLARFVNRNCNDRFGKRF